MRRVYLLAYSDSLGTREQVKQCLNKMQEVIAWRLDPPHAFYIVSEESAPVLANRIREILGKGRFIVTEIDENRQGWLTQTPGI
jgi:hypothetical protein